MNSWTKKSIKLANQKDYLDQLYKVYPVSKNIKRNPTNNLVEKISKNINQKNNTELIKSIICNKEKENKDLPFPVKDSYVAFLRHDNKSIDRNPKTIDRLSGMIYEIGINKAIENMSKPIETNRQMGPMFQEWINKNSLGVKETDDVKKFLSYKGNIIFTGNDSFNKDFAKQYLGYNRDKGIDFLGKFNDTYVIGEAKFLTDFGGHQNDQMNDALSTLRSNINQTKYKVKKIAILDGVLYINNKGKMQKKLKEAKDDEVILSSLFLRDYLYTL